MNIIGEHIDYLGGFVLPFACDRELRLEAEAHPDEVVLTSADMPGEVRVPLDGSAEPPDGWGRQVWGVVETLRSEGVDIHGLHGTIHSSIPVGAGLSSSAALEVAVALAVSAGRMPDPAVLARAELLATGVPVGVMDQTTLLEAEAGHAILLDCAARTYEQIPIHPAIGFVVIDTGTRRRLADGRYAQRRADVEAAFAAAGAASLRDLNARSIEEPRLRHAVAENKRVLDAVGPLREGAVDVLGGLLSESHASLRDDFEVSSSALDRAVSAAEDQPGCTGARLVGAGFAGCVIAVVEAGREEEFVASYSMPHALWPVRAADHAGEI